MKLYRMRAFRGRAAHLAVQVARGNVMTYQALCGHEPGESVYNRASWEPADTQPLCAECARIWWDRREEFGD